MSSLKAVTCLVAILWPGFSAGGVLGEKKTDQKTPTAESRLLGQWKSDLAASMDFNDKHARLTDSQSALLRQLLGKLTLDFDGTNCASELPAHALTGSTGKVVQMPKSRQIEPYTVLGATDSAVAVKTKAVNGDQLSILHFDGDCMWTYVGDSPLAPLHIREYFRRIK